MGQLELPTLRSVAPVSQAAEVDAIALLPTIRRLPTLHHSIELARELCLLPDKQIYDPVGIDQGAFSRMRSGSAWYPQDERWPKILNTMRTEIPVIWQVESLGYDWTSLRKHKSDLEAQLEDANKRIRELEHERDIELRALRAVFAGRK